MGRIPDDLETAPPGVVRRVLLAFDDPKAFWNEYTRNLVRGGAQLACAESFEPREIIEVLLEAGFAGAKHVLAAEVVFSGGGQLAVQFLDPAPELRERLAPLVERAERAVAEAASSGRQALAGPGADLDGAFGDVSLDDGGLALGSGGGASLDALEGFEATSQVPDDATDPNERTYRERAQRDPTRVAVAVKGPTGKPLIGRTRDISETGLLLSVEGEELPVGRAVRVELVHPASGERLEVPGQVVRHLEGEGVVPAVAVAFQPGVHRETLARLVADLKAADAEQRRTGIRGPLEELGGPSMLQMFAALSKQGTLTVSHGVEEGFVAFGDGMLVAARVGAVEGVKALARILSWRDGFFEFRGHVDPIFAGESSLPMEGAILEALRVIDESNRAAGPQLAPTARLEVSRARLARLGAPLNKTEQAVLELAAAGFTVRRILDVIPETDAAVRTAMTALIERGLIRPT